MSIKGQPVNAAVIDIGSHYPKVGVGVMVLKDGKVLLGRRKNAHGSGEYANTGGHVEHLESLFETARRETMEEAGITIKNIRFLCLSNITEYAPKHYIDIGLLAEWESGEPQVLEPNKREGWGWYDLDNLPQPLFAPSARYIESYKTGCAFWDQ
ncbi:MAG: NUDIX domain-containing protein [Candidatus Andersenbacteria bacterium]